MEYALRGFFVVLGLGPENTGDEGLGITVVEREPAGLYLDHDAVAGKENVIGVGKREAVKERLVTCDWSGSLKAFAVATAENIGRDHELEAAHGSIHGDFVGVDVNELDDPIGIGAGCRGDQIGDRLAADFYGVGEHRGDEGEDVWAPGGLALIVD